MDLLDAHDQEGPYPASYYAATANKSLDFPRLGGDTDCDVCIVGAGFTGLSAALHLAGHGRDVVLLDAHRAGWGASGRNGGQLGTGHRLDQDRLEQLVGKQRARAFWDIAEDAKTLVRELIEAHGIACNIKPGIIHADHKRRFVAHTARYVRLLREQYGYEQISFLDREALSAHLGTNAYHGGALDWGAAHLHPLNLALGLADAAARAGVRIFERTRVTQIVPGKKVTVRTAHGDVRAGQVLIAANGYLGGLMPEIGARVMPINSYIVATESLPEEMAREIIRDDVAVADSRFVVNYYRLSADRRLLFGGRESYGYRYPNDIAQSVKRRMLGIYPQLRDVKVDYAWGGTLGITMSRMPHLARLSANILSASGYSGHGLGMAIMSGRLVAEAIAGRAERFDVMASMPARRFPGGTMLRRPLLVMAMLYYALRDRM